MHPALTYLLAARPLVCDAGLRSAVMTAAMAPGVNAYLFAHMYGVAKRVAASSVLVATALSMITSGSGCRSCLKRDDNFCRRNQVLRAGHMPDRSLGRAFCDVPAELPWEG